MRSDSVSTLVRYLSSSILNVVDSGGDMFVRHLNIKAADLHVTFEEKIERRQLPEFVKIRKKQIVCRLKRSIYGLRQFAPCKKLNKVLI